MITRKQENLIRKILGTLVILLVLGVLYNIDGLMGIVTVILLMVAYLVGVILLFWLFGSINFTDEE